MSAESGFGKWLKERRLSLRLTQAELAELVSCAPDTIRMIENERRRPSREMAEVLARHLGLDPGEAQHFVEFARGSSNVPPAPLAPPTARIVSRRGHTLPLLPTPLVGRETDLTRLVELLVAPKPRLITLTGPPGIGKTSLAIVAAGEAAAHFPDSVYFVPLAPLTAAELVLPTIAGALGVTTPPDRPLVEALHDYLWTRNLLLVLDNFEQLMPAAPLLAEMLQLAPKLKLLITSRGALKLRGEKEVVLTPLSVPMVARQGAPAAKEGAALEHLLEYAAVRLFVDRSAEARDGFALTAENAAAVAEVTRQLDGLPLAIELAAARIRVLSPQAILDRLTSRLELLSDGPVDLPPRQRTLRGAIAWGHDLLAPHEQALFRRLAVFAGGWTLEAAEAIARDEDAKSLIPAPGSRHSAPAVTQHPTLSTLGGLVRMSMLRVEELDGAARFGMLETIRDYAAEKLEQSGEAEEARHVHARFFLTLAETAEKEFVGPNPTIWLNRLESEHDNLRAVLRWALDGQLAALALRLAAALWRFWWLHSYMAEGRAWLAEALRLDQRLAAAGAPVEPAVRALALTGAGILSREQGDYDEAQALLEESVALRRGLGDKSATADALTFLGVVLASQGRFAAARALYDEALVLAEEDGSQIQLSRALLNKSTVAVSEGKYDEARLLLEQTLALSRAVGHKANVGTTLHNLGIVMFQLGDFARARAYHEESLVIRRELGNRSRIASGLNHLGNILYQQGDTAGGLALLEESLKMRREVGGRSDLGASLGDLAAVMLDQGEYETARAYLRESLRLHMATGARDAIAHSLTWMGGVAAGQGRPEQAALMLGAAAAVREALGIPVSAIDMPRYNRILALGQQSVDAAAWARAWEQGRATPLATIVEEALRDS